MSAAGSGVAVQVDAQAAAYGVVPIGRHEVAALAVQIGDILGLSTASLDIRITTDFGIAGLHARYLGCVGPTNVLSFPNEYGGGSLVLNAQAVAREAWLYAQDPLEHWVRLVAHGLLHLYGLDHGPAMDAATETAVEQAGIPCIS